jgi:hypothetical protein
MGSKDIVLTCVWSSDDFVVIDSKTKPTSDEAVLKIDEGSEKISIQIPSEFSLIKKKIIERRVQSISKAGFAIPNTSLRIGGGFQIEMETSEEIPDVLLQEGHKYTYGEFTPQNVPSETKVERPTLPSQLEYTPSFLKYDQEEEIPGSTVTKLSEETSPIQELSSTEIAPEIVSEEKPIITENLHNEAIAGSFVIALSEYGDIYLSKDDESYSIEYSLGRVDFNIQEGQINVLSTDRIPPDDQSIESAIKKVKNGFK